MMLPDLALIFLVLVDTVVVDIYARFQLLIRLLLIYMPDFNFLSNIFAKIFIVLQRNMKNLSQPSCFCYK